MKFQPALPQRFVELEQLYPVRVAAFELSGSAPPDELLPGEAVLVQAKSPIRQDDFTAGRACAHHAMSALGRSPSPIMIGPSRAPIWPAGLTGSISHTTGLTVAVVAETTTPAFGVGVDAEVIGRVDAEIEAIILDETERKALDDLSSRERALAATTMFGAKEAFYKAQWPHTSSWVGFQDVTASIDDGDVVLHAKSDLEALQTVVWPVRTRHVMRTDIVVVACVAYTL